MNKTKKAEDTKRLKDLLRKGKYKTYSRINTVSRSGMSRTIDFFMAIGAGEMVNINYYISKTCGYSRNKDGAIRVSGCGMDMGFAVIYDLGRVLYKQNGSNPGYKITNTWI